MNPVVIWVFIRKFKILHESQQNNTTKNSLFVKNSYYLIYST